MTAVSWIMLIFFNDSKDWTEHYQLNKKDTSS
jgi:hypothetical protein